jgi:pyruvate,orthophosphate dikinase
MNRYAPLYIGTVGQSDDELAPELAGSKGALIWQMKRLGLNVPPAFVLPTELSQPERSKTVKNLAALYRGLHHEIARLEETTGRRLGGARAPFSSRCARARQSPCRACWRPFSMWASIRRPFAG